MKKSSVIACTRGDTTRVRHGARDVFEERGGDIICA